MSCSPILSVALILGLSTLSQAINTDKINRDETGAESHRPSVFVENPKLPSK